MTKFKTGDQVRVAEGTQGYYGHDLGGKTGVVEDWPKTPRNHTLVRFDDTNRYVPTEALTLIAPTEDEKIEAALAQTKEDLGLCGDFDKAVERARNMTFVERLDHIAISMNRGDVFAHFESVLNKPEYVMPELPKTGDYVRVTYVDGTTHESEVTGLREPGRICQFYNIHFREERWTVVPVDAEAYTKYFETEPGNIVIKVEHIERPIEIPEIGKWIEATDAEGTTKVIEVNQNYLGFRDNFTIIGTGASNFHPYKARIASAGYSDPAPRGNIVEWKYVAPPKEEVKPVEIDGYWIVRNRKGRVVAYLTERDAKQDRDPQTGADTVEGVEANIADWASRPYLRRYIPMALAIIKFLERSDNEED